MATQISEIKKAIDAFDLEKARTLLRIALKEPDTEIYYLAPKVAISDNQRRNFLQKALDIDPFYEEAQQSLNDLDSKNTSSQPTYSPVLYIMGIVSQTTLLYLIPNKRGTIRTQVSGDSQTVLLTRTENSLWLNVLWMSSTGRQVLGWLPVSVVSNINIQGQPVSVANLPITNYEYNTVDHINELIWKVLRDRIIRLSWIWVPWVGFMVVRFVLSQWQFLFNAQLTLLYDQIGTFQSIYNFIFIILIYIIGRPYALQIQQLNRIRKYKQVRIENPIENQMQNDALTAANLLSQKLFSNSLNTK